KGKVTAAHRAIASSWASNPRPSRATTRLRHGPVKPKRSPSSTRPNPIPMIMSKAARGPAVAKQPKVSRNASNTSADLRPVLLLPGELSASIAFTLFGPRQTIQPVDRHLPVVTDAAGFIVHRAVFHAPLGDTLRIQPYIGKPLYLAHQEPVDGGQMAGIAEGHRHRHSRAADLFQSTDHSVRLGHPAAVKPVLEAEVAGAANGARPPGGRLLASVKGGLPSI